MCVCARVRPCLFVYLLSPRGPVSSNKVGVHCFLPSKVCLFGGNSVQQWMKRFQCVDVACFAVIQTELPAQSQNIAETGLMRRRMPFDMGQGLGKSRDRSASTNPSAG